MVEPADLRLAHVIHSSFGVESLNGFLTVVFAAERWSGRPVNRAPDKHSRVTWVDTDELPDEFVDTTGTAPRHDLAGDDQLSIAGR